MKQELAYAIVTPYTIRKSRTGSVLARLLGQAGLDLVATQMIAPTQEMAERFAQSIRSGGDEEDEFCRALIRDYILENMTPDPETGKRQRIMMLVFRGENAHSELFRIIGKLHISSQRGETIRNAFGDLVYNNDGSVRYFEPALIMSDYPTDLNLWLDLLKDQPPILEGVCHYDENTTNIQRTLVIIKPDSWRLRSARPGAILGMFSRTGLRIIGCKVNRMSVNQALEFYGPVKNALCRKLAPAIAERARCLLEKEFNLKLGEKELDGLRETVGNAYAVSQFESLIEFMSGRRPGECPEAERDLPGGKPSLALVYEGADAVAKIRDVLGPTDPTQAPDGTVRREFGSSVMINTAHASDSPENAVREMKIINMQESNFNSAVSKLLEENGYDK